LAPKGSAGSGCNCRPIVESQRAVDGHDATEVFESVEGRLEAPALAIQALVVADLSLRAACVRDEWYDTTLSQISAPPVGVVVLVGGEAAE